MVHRTIRQEKLLQRKNYLEMREVNLTLWKRSSHSLFDRAVGTADNPIVEGFCSRREDGGGIVRSKSRQNASIRPIPHQSEQGQKSGAHPSAEGLRTGEIYV
jgi:hypothetical protein